MSFSAMRSGASERYGPFSGVSAASSGAGVSPVTGSGASSATGAGVSAAESNASSVTDAGASSVWAG